LCETPVDAAEEKSPLATTRDDAKEAVDISAGCAEETRESMFAVATMTEGDVAPACAATLAMPTRAVRSAVLATLSAVEVSQCEPV